MISAIVSLPEGDVVAGFELLEREFAGGEEALLRYFESTYAGQLVNGERNRPLSPQELWRASGRADVGTARANNAVESPRKAFASGLVQADHPGVWRFVESLKAQQNITKKDIVSENRGFLSLTKREPKSFYSNDAVAISLVVKCNTLLGFEKKSFSPNTAL